MIQILVIAMFVAVHLHDAAALDEPAPAAPALTLLITILPCLALLVHTAATVAGRAIDRRGSLQAVAIVDRVASISRLTAAGAVVFAILRLHWLTIVRASIGDWVLLDELLAMAPFLLFLLFSWWSTYPIERRLKDAVLLRTLDSGLPLHPSISRAQFVLTNLRHQILLVLLPLGLISAWEEAVPKAATLLGLAPNGPHWWTIAEPFITWGGVLTCFLAAPALMHLAWDTVRIGPGSVRDQVLRICRQHRTRVSGPFLWRTHGSILNGAVIGILYPFRYILFTDALIERLSSHQLEGVIAHEVAHMRCHHPAWMAAGVLACVVILSTAISVLQAVLGPHLFPDDASIPLTLATLAAAALAFGWISRRFEWQADAFAARHLSAALPSDSDGSVVITPQAVLAMASALGEVADINGTSRHRFDFRHGSIALRQARLASLEKHPHARLPIDRTVLWIKAATAFILGLAITAAALTLLTGGSL